MKLVILVSFLILLPMFSSELVETSHVDNIYNKVNEVPHPRPPTPSYRINYEVDEVVTKGRDIDIEDGYADPDPPPRIVRPGPYVPPPPPPSPPQ